MSSDHYLHIVSWEDPEPDWWVQHTEDCEITTDQDGISSHACYVGAMIDQYGLEAFGAFRSWLGTLPHEPGKYAIEFYDESHYSYIYGDIDPDYGLRLKENTGQTN